MTSMDGLARSLSDLRSIVDDLTARGVSVRFLKEGQIYSKDSTPVAKLMLGLLGSVAEFERSIIRERQAEGIARAKQRGVYKGRAKALTAEQVEQAKRWIDEGIPKTKVAKRLGIGRTTLYRSTLKSSIQQRHHKVRISSGRDAHLMINLDQSSRQKNVSLRYRSRDFRSETNLLTVDTSARFSVFSDTRPM
ncbi:recombinase family protein [Corynebacterium auriscanis]|uniref:recombinase family protein n=1 Tax=Corynebacterium auriscanis TaxID=99807 RepID=UPI003CEC3F52